MYATAAVPEDPVTALSSNPAGITRLDGLQLTFGFQTPLPRFNYRSPTGYDHSSSPTPVAPAFGLSTDRWDPWYFAIGAYGSLGLTTDFPADPAGAPMTSSRLLNQLGVLRLAPTVAYRFSDSLSIGAGLLPAYGWQEAERPVPVALLPGGGAGTAAANFALSYRTRGKLSLHGDVSVGGFKDRVDVVYELPQSIVASLAYQPRPRTTVAVQIRWTDWTALNHSKSNFHRLDVFDARMSNHARSIAAFGGGIEHVTDRGLALRASVFYEGRAAGAADLWPNLVDAGYTGFSVGLGYPVGPYKVDFYAGMSLLQTTRVAQSDTGFPGTYDVDNGYSFGIQFTRVWKGAESGADRK
jgi:long-subunit fatty acid transport protein